MNCFMGYNPLVAKEVKITTWIKEFDGDSPVYPSFPNEGDCFVVFATDEDALTHNALSKKTYTNGEWADAEGGGGGGGATFPTFTHDDETGLWSCDKTYNECLQICENSPTSPADPSYPCLMVADGFTNFNMMVAVEDTGICIYTFDSTITYHSDGTITEERT